jgi:NAD(P)-dependent dehydrogenase (short-subunit alcohol dehydrogenase family)
MKKTVLITGTSSGIGRSAAITFAQNGWNVVATMRSPEKEQELQKIQNLRVVALDVTDNASIKNAFDEAVAAFGRVDAVVNNAGYGVDGVFEAMSDEVIEKQFNTNVFGLMRVTREAIGRMRAQGGGTIIQIASVGGRVTFPLYSIYHGTKWAVEGFSESLAYELRQFNIRMKIVEPGAIKTEFYGSSRHFVKPEGDNGYDALLDKAVKIAMDAGEKGADPQVVADVILKAANANNWRLRYAISYPANLLLPLRRLLPESWFFAMVRSTYKI